MSTLELREVVKRYATGAEVVGAVDGVSLSVAPGEFVALYGPSGAGKSTLLMMAAAIKRPDRGQVLFGEQAISDMSERESARFRREQLGVVFQSFHLSAGATALDNAALKLFSLGIGLSKAREMVLPWLDRVGLSSRAHHKPGELSMGERQRVAIARALANNPRLLLADEPTGNLDSRRSREVLAMLAEICAEQNIPVLLVTHDPQAAQFATRVCTLRDGQLSEGLDLDLHVSLSS